MSSKSTSFNNIAPNPSKTVSSIKDSLTNIFFGSDIAVAFTIIIGLTIIAIGSIIMFENIIPNMRTQFSSNIVSTIGAVGFIFVIFRFMGTTTIILGKESDTGMILYVLSVILLLFICSG
jgi:hypothetical protein